jgi:integrase
MAKRRANHEGSIYRDKAGVWWAEYRPAEGPRIRRRAKTQAAAREKLRQIEADAQRGVDLSKKQPTVAEWCQTWLETYTTNLKSNVKEDYAGVIQRYIVTAPFAGRRLEALTPAAVQHWINDLTTRYAPRTVRNAHARLHRALSVAVRYHYIARNPAAGAELPPERAPKVQILDFDQARAFLDALTDHRLYAFFRLAIGLGLRLAELTGLSWAAADLIKGKITIQQQLRRVKGEWVVQPTKTKAGARTLMIDADLVAVLRAHKARQAEEKLRLGPKWDSFAKAHDLMFVSGIGAPLHARVVHDHFTAALQRAKLPTIRFHDLRHTAASLLLADGVPLVTVSKILGHASPAITATIYAHALDENKADAIAGLSKRLRRA